MTSTLSLPGSGKGPVPDRKDLILKRSMRASALMIVVCFGFVGGWLAIARLDSAAVAPGVLENAGTTKTIQHLEGGIVREILVTNGDEVREGDLLLRLDPTQSEASAQLFETQLLTSRARRQRLEAEIVMATALAFDADLKAVADTNPAIAKILGDEARQFELRRQELAQARDILQTNIGQARAEIEAFLVSRGIAEREIALLKADLADQKSLLERGLTSQARVTELEQDSLAQEEKIAQSDIEVARIEQSILGFQLQIAQLEQEYRNTAAEQLEAINREIRSLERDSIVANDYLERVEIRAPVDGTVQESVLGTVGAVVRGGETLMKIAPLEDDYIISAKVSPNDIEGILPGSAAQITFPAFQTLELKPADGELISLSRDRVVDQRTQIDYYEARIRLDETSLPDGVRTRLVAGMSASVVLPTGQRTALNYLLGPITRRLQNAMREE